MTNYRETMSQTLQYMAIVRERKILERELESILANPKSEKAVMEAQKKREEIIDLMSTDGGRVLSEFIEYMETDYVSDAKKIKYKTDADGNKIRFRNGFPEKIGGWSKYSSTTYQGSARRLHNWVALDGSDNMRLVVRYSGGCQTGVGADIVRQS